ncbi:MAG: hypothetical protein K2H22_06690, partial [Muribaculaceae bacterium]|nr:hypothetical protein [Muribaculaceae bacterium]
MMHLDVRFATASRKLSVDGQDSEDFDINADGLNDVRLWSPEDPYLYKVSVEILKEGEVIDSGACRTAFRTFGFDGEGRFLLNGKPYKLRGMCRHQDRRPNGIALLDEQHRTDVRLAKEMGANFMRISHYPQDDAVLEMCDRLGLIVWEEIPVIDYVPDIPGFDDNCEAMLRDMVRRHRNHPSIAMWGYMNEILLRVPEEGRDATLDRTRKLAHRLESVVRDEDPDRLTTMAFHGSDAYHDAGLSGITDVKGWNLYQGWYGGRLDGFGQYLSRQHREHPDHKLIVSEYGAGSDLRIHSFSPEPFDFSVEYQQKYLEHYLPVIEDSAFVAGASHWNLIDFSSANREESMPRINNKGILTNDRKKKDVFYYYAAMWHDPARDTIVHIAVDDWKERTDIVSADGKVSHPIKIYTNLPSIGLSVNGLSVKMENAGNRTAIFNVSLSDGRNTLVASDPVSLTHDGPLLQSCRKGISGYSFDVEPGDYEVELLFAELAAPIEKSAYLLGVDMGEGESEWTNMDIVINGRSVEKGFSPGVASGGKSLVRRRYQPSARAGNVRIEFRRTRGTTQLSAV